MNGLKPGSSSLIRQSALGGPATRIVGAFTQLPFLIRQLGADPMAVFAEAGLDSADLAQPSQRVEYGKLMSLFDEAARQAECPHFGVLAGRLWQLSDLGPVGELMRHSRNIGIALEELVIFQHLNSEGAVAFLLSRRDTVDLGYTFYVPLKENTAQFYDAVMAAAVNFMRELCGDEWEPSAVLFPHSQPTYVEPYRRHFRSKLVFDSPICALRFLPEELNRPIATANEELYQTTLLQLRSAQGGSVVDTVSRTLRSLLLHGQASAEDVARSLAMHQRTLGRRLKAEGVTFQQILDSVRFAIAKELLESSDVSLNQIATSLGYADPESFFRAFKKWSGMPPGSWRESTH